MATGDISNDKVLMFSNTHRRIISRVKRTGFVALSEQSTTTAKFLGAGR